MSEIARIEYDEFGLFHENAAEFGLAFAGPPVVRRQAVMVDDSHQLSALVWGTEDPEFVFLHGGAQNAHTWDTVALALNRSMVAIDLPGHGHSDEARFSSVDVTANAADIAAAIRAVAPVAQVVIGMSLGGMTALALSAQAPELVHKLVLVDVTPGVNAKKSQVISAFINGPDSFQDFDALLARTIEYNPTRTVSSLRRGILHNALQRPDGSWAWRYARLRPPADAAGSTGSDAGGHPNFSALWDAVSGLKVPLMLVRGMLAQSVVDDDDEAEVRRRQPSAEIVHVDNAGHSVQGDAPVELARMIARFADTPQ